MSIVKQFDVAVVGGGPGGYVAAIRAAQLGARVALVEKGKVGGTCLNVGCIPTKALVATAETLVAARRGAALGISGSLSLDLAGALGHKEAVVAQMVGGVERLLAAHGVELLRGIGRLIDARTVAVETKDAAITLAMTRGIILAPGSVPAFPPFGGANLSGVLDSTAALELPEVPRRLVIIGGGVIGVEFASIYSSFGSTVTVLEYLPTLLPGFDADLGRRLQLAFRRAGIAVQTRSKVEAILESAPLVVRGTGPRGGFEVEADAVLVATGRRPATDGLGLEDAGVRTERGAVLVDGRLETSVPGVYAVGDAVGGAMLAHRAMVHGRFAAENLLGGDRRLDEEAVPSCVFSIPEVATVGLSLAEAERRGLAAEEVSFPFSSNGRALAVGEGFGEAKLVCAPGGGRVLGVHIVGPHASDLVLEGSLAVRLGLTAADLADTVHPHPTYGEALMEAALGCRGSMIHHLRSSAGREAASATGRE
jgi:dihydrolipoamide dehydrogenase